MPVGADQDVLRLQVAVDDARGVQALDALDDLRSVEAGAVAAQASPTSELCGKVSTGVEVLRDAVRTPGCIKRNLVWE